MAEATVGQTAEDLTKKFGIEGVFSFDQGPGGLVRARVHTAAAEAEIYLHGAHVTGWTPRGQQPVLFLSKRSEFAPDKAIRGGVPVIFPWFGPTRRRAAGAFARLCTHLSMDTRRSGCWR